MVTNSNDSKKTDAETTVWLLADRADRTAALEHLAGELSDRGVRARVVSLTDVIGSAAREAVAGGAERLLRSLRVVFGGESGSADGDGGEEDFLGAFRRVNPDVLALTSSRWVRPLSLLESVAGTPTVQVGLLTDFNLDDGWFHGDLDAFVVPAELQSNQLGERGVLDDRRFVAGPPTEPRFLEPSDRELARREFGFESPDERGDGADSDGGDDRADETAERVALVRAETFAPTTLRKLVFQATLVDTPTRFLFHHNGDGAIANILRDAADEHGLPAAMFGRVTDLERYIVAADIVIASPAESMVAEITGQRRPIVFIGEPGDHQPQVDVLTEEYGASHLENVVQFGSGFDRLFSDGTFDELEKAAASSGLGPNNEAVIEALLDCAARIEELATPVQQGGGGERTTDEPDAGDTTGGLPSKHGFEPIGRGDSASGDGSERRSGSGPSLSRAEARDQLAELILRERELERKLDEADREQSRWRDRLELAREWNEADLAEEAEQVLREHIDEAESLKERLTDIREQKRKLKEAAGRTVSSPSGQTPGDGTAGGQTGATDRANREDLEERFDDMEIERELDDLRDRIKGELGEE